jgi:hypothetical protein
MEKASHGSERGTANSPSRARYWTLALLLAWVAAVFAFTLWKFGGAWR